MNKCYDLTGQDRTGQDRTGQDRTGLGESIFIGRINTLRILFATLIVIGHCSMAFDREVPLLWIIHKFNMVGVCYFFFTSGIGCANSASKKKISELGTYTLRKIISLAIIVLISRICWAYVNFIYANTSLQNLLTLNSFIGDINWYIWVQLYFYALLFFAYRFINTKRSRILFLCVGAIIEMLVAYAFNLSHAYCYSSLGFPMGVFFHEYYNNYFENHKVGWKHCLIFGLFVVASCSCLILPDNIFTVIVMRNVTCCGIIFILAVILINSSRLALEKIHILTSLQKYSTEIYLYQFLALSILGQMFAEQGRDIDIKYVFAVLTLTFALAYIMNAINASINNRIFPNVKTLKKVVK